MKAFWRERRNEARRGRILCGASMRVGEKCGRVKAKREAAVVAKCGSVPRR